jgi:hypothetical protein
MLLIHVLESKTNTSVTRMATNHLDGNRANFGNVVSNIPQRRDSAELKICMMNQPLSQTYEKNEFRLYLLVSAHVISRDTQAHTPR